MKYVFIPGTLCDRRVWASQINFLKEKGSNVNAKDIFVADLTKDSSISKMATRLLKQVAGPMTIIAFSLGTQVAFEITKISPKQVKRLLLSGAACGKLTPKLALTLEASIASVSQDFNLYLTDVFPKYLAQNGLNYKETKSTFIAMAKSLGKDVCIRQLQAVLATTITKQDLTKINCPTLIIAGDLDRRTPPDVQQELKRTIPNAKLAMIKGAEHFVTLQAPNVINNLMASWLGDILNEHANSTL